MALQVIDRPPSQATQRAIAYMVASGIVGCSVFFGSALAVRRAPPPAAIDAYFAPAERRAVRALQLVSQTPGSTGASRLQITDIGVRISAGRQDVDALLALANEATPIRGRAVFEARLNIVAGGRLYRDAAAQCGPWRQDIARCVLVCEGGSFRLQRPQLQTTETAELTRLRLVFDGDIRIEPCAFAKPIQKSLRANAPPGQADPVAIELSRARQ